MIKNRHFAAVVNNKASLIQFIVLMMIKHKITVLFAVGIFTDSWVV